MAALVLQAGSTARLGAGVLRTRYHSDRTSILHGAKVPSTSGPSLLPAQRRRIATVAALHEGEATPGQKLRGHGPGGWKGAGLDIAKPSSISPDVKDLLLTYGQLAQATYDNLGMDLCDQATYGNPINAPADMLTYQTKEYPLAPDAGPATSPGLADRYKLPLGGRSPVINGLPGQPVDGLVQPLNRPWWDIVIDKVFQTVSGVLITFTGSRVLFQPDPATGRNPKARGTFIGYVAVSDPQGDKKEVDVALVWRGTIFKEEWESNFAKDELTVWKPVAEMPSDFNGGGVTPHPSEIGVHDGFYDLYNQPIEQPDGARISPRKAVREILSELCEKQNVTTITSTGHSLGGALSTICAFGVAHMLKHEWKQMVKPHWVTQEPPKVTLISFASPRVGNYVFGTEFEKLGASLLRVVNKGDSVPKVPGLWVQALAVAIDAMPFGIGRRGNLDSSLRLWRLSGWLYQQVCLLAARLGWRSRWGYLHAGSALELDPADGVPVVKENLGLGQKHNLELHLFLLSQLGLQDARKSTRNPLLLNKSDDVWSQVSHPADWWRTPDVRNCKLVNGRWEHRP